MKTIFAAALAFCATGAFAQPPDGRPDGPAVGLWQQGFGPKDNAPGGGGGGPLINHGGPVLPNSKIYYIWWGTSASGSWPSDAQTGLVNLASDLTATTSTGFMHDIFPQYMGNTPLSSSFGGSMQDGSTPPKSAPSTAAIVSEACNIIGKNGTNGFTTDPNGVYVVLTNNFPTGANYCAWHSYGTCSNGITIKVAYVPNTAGVSGCNVNWSSGITYSAGTNSIANVLSHEFSEAITDPNLNAWYDRRGSEIGDKCAWTFNGNVNIGGINWQLQQEWSNAAGGCIQQ